MQNLDFNNIFPNVQWDYIHRISAILPAIYGDNPKASVITFGCQQNVSDSEKLKGMLFACGYNITEDISEADFVIFNTCAVFSVPLLTVRLLERGIVVSVPLPSPLLVPI